MLRRYLFVAALFAILNVVTSSMAWSLDPKPSGATYDKASLPLFTQQAWISAISNDKASTLAHLLAEHESESLLKLTASNGKSALMVAAKVGDLVLVKALIAAGADVKATTATRGTPFMFAVLGGHRDVAQWLIDQGADINTVGSNGWTALTIAAAKGRVDLLEWLIGQGADTQVRDVYRFTPFMRAVNNGFVEAAAILLSLADTDVNARDEFDNTALHHAAAAGNTEMVKLLLEHKAKPELFNRENISPVQLARSLQRNSDAIVQALEKALEH